MSVYYGRIRSSSTVHEKVRNTYIHEKLDVSFIQIQAFSNLNPALAGVQVFQITRD